jgi:5'-AMP-activated protein kinase regulatory gamma subunit
MQDEHHPVSASTASPAASSSSSSPYPAPHRNHSIFPPPLHTAPVPTPFLPSPSSSSAPAPSASSPSSLSARVNSFRSACLDVLVAHQTHHLIPHSSKVIVFDSKLKVQHAFDGLVTHDINCAPVWDSARRKYVGMLSVSDFLDILLATAGEGGGGAAGLAALSGQRLCDWAEFKKSRGTSINRLLCISPESTLHEAVRQLLNDRVHRLCVVQLALADTILRILTNHGILRFLRQSCPQFNGVSVRDLGIGVFHNLVTLTYETPISRAMEMLSQYRVSSIPVVDSSGRPIDVYSRSDVRYLAMDSSWSNLDMTIEQALSPHQPGRTLPLCTRDDSLMTVSGLLVACNKHSLVCVNAQDGTVEGIVSLTDIFSFILNSGPPKAESRIAALKADLERGETESMGGAVGADSGGAQQAGAEDELRRRGLVPVVLGAAAAASPGAAVRSMTEDDSEMGDAADIPEDEDFTR